MRAFIAVDLSEEIRAKIKEIQRLFLDLDIQEKLKLKFVKPEQAHQTVKFLGDIPKDRIEEVKRALEEISQQPFDIVLRGVGFFPAASPEKVRNIRVIWVGMEKGVEELKALQRGVESKMHALGFPLEKRFSSHVTLCRVKMWSRARTQDEIGRLLKKIAELREVEVGEMHVNEIKLKHSTLTPKGPIYEDVYVKRLGE
ncbi:MAG: RNA 2',3'-cyclic phosphodiesterase [Methanophagales archaeon]|nr:RNA 2',3'-cyclic phosphodiesterase [Methanophagales archaeon]